MASVRFKQVISASAVGLLYSNAPQYLWEAGYTETLPRTSYAIVCGIAVLYFVVTLLTASRGSRDASVRQHRVNRRALFVWTVAYVLGGIFAWTYAERAQFELALQGVFVTSALFICYLILINDAATTRAAQIAVAVVVAWCAIVNTVELIAPGQIIKSISVSLGEGRAAGFYINPNNAGSFIVLGMIVSITALPKMIRWPFCMLSAYATLLTFSRTAMLMWIVAVIGLSATGVFKLNRFMALMVSIAILAGLVAIQSGTFREQVGSAKLGEGAKTRLQYDANDASVHGRLYVARRSVELMKESPLIGYGLGATKSGATLVNPHNQFLYVGVEQGLVGLAILLALFGILARCRSEVGVVFALALLIAFFFNHNMLQYHSTFIAVAVTCGATPVVRANRKRWRMLGHGVNGRDGGLFWNMVR